jgi:ferredoxin
MAMLRFKDVATPAKPGQTLLEELLDARAPVVYLCMGGTCGTCRVRIVSGGEHLEPRGDGENAHDLAADERLACQAVVKGTGDVTVDQD